MERQSLFFIQFVLVVVLDAVLAISRTRTSTTTRTMITLCIRRTSTLGSTTVFLFLNVSYEQSIDHCCPSKGDSDVFEQVQERGVAVLIPQLSPKRKDYPDQPRVAVGAIVFKDDQILLVRRGKPPSRDLWAIPGGSVKICETLQRAAEREIFEETGITIQALEPVYAFDYIEKDESGCARFHYVIIDLTAKYVKGEPRAGDDAAEARWVSSLELATLKVSSKTRQLLKERFDFG